ncbi:MAG: tail fiber domain-containing protein [Bacteroidales bacterium]|nr:tail fiber domain-containing protein [Bacteroidales bacterium]
MKKFFLSAAILSLGMLFSQPLTAQIKVLSNSFEINKPNMLFAGSSSKFTISNKTMEIKLYRQSGIMTASDDVTANGIVMPPYQEFAPLSIIGPKHDFGIGAPDFEILRIYSKEYYSSTATGIASISDRRYKTNIKALSPALDKIMRLNPVTFDYLEEKDGERSADPARQNRVGLIAQELLEIVPEAVRHMEPEDIYVVDYTVLIPFLVKTIQEQQVQIDDLQLAMVGNNADQSTPDATFNSVKPKDTPAEMVKAEGNRLWSNVPNPFKQETRIRYALTEDVREAQLCIYDLSGKQLSCHRLNDRGESEFTLRAASLMPGIYLYSLIADGNVVDTHRMVVTE